MIVVLSTIYALHLNGYFICFAHNLGKFQLRRQLCQQSPNVSTRTKSGACLDVGIVSEFRLPQQVDCPLMVRPRKLEDAYVNLNIPMGLGEPLGL